MSAPIALARGLMFPAALTLLLGSRQAQATETFDAYTLSALVNQSVNAMAAHQRLQRAQSLTNYNAMYFGMGARGAPARYRMSDGTVLDAGIARVLLAVGGRASWEEHNLSAYAGLQLDMASASGYPNIFGPAGSGGGKGAKVVGFFSEAILYAGGSFSGLSVSGGLLAQSLRFDGDPAGRFVPYGYPAESKRSFRPGTPSLARARQGEQQNQWSHFVTLDHDEGFALGALFGEVERIRQQGQSEVNRTLAALRGMAQPYQLIRKVLPRTAGLPGLGLNRYAEGLDYYGDRFKALQSAVASGDAMPATPPQATYEVPLVWERIAGTPLSARVVNQVRPEMMFRLAEVSAITEYKSLQAGARAMVFRRGESYTGSTDLFGGYFVPSQGGRAGMSANVSYSYNSPDMSTFLPLPNAHVLGLQLMFGLPEAMPPPVPIARDPLVERKQGKEESSP